MAPCPHKTDSISACVLSVWSWNTHTSTLRELGREAVNGEREKEEKSRKRQEVESDSGEEDVKRRSKRQSKERRTKSSFPSFSLCNKRANQYLHRNQKGYYLARSRRSGSRQAKSKRKKMSTFRNL